MNDILETIGNNIRSGKWSDKAIKYALKANNVDIVEAYEKGEYGLGMWMAKHKVYTKKSGEKAFFYAARHGFPMLLQQLFKNGSGNDDGRSLYKEEALYNAAAVGRSACVELLLEYGADVHYRGDIALRWAAAFDHIECVKILLEAGANVYLIEDHIIESLEHSDCGKLIKEWRRNNEH